MHFRHSELILDLKVLEKNLQVLKSWSKNSFFCPMLKANAYGHGIHLFLPALHANKINCVGVALIEEGIQLRHLGYTGQILVFGYFPSGCANTLVEERLTPVIGDYADFENIKAVADKIFVHLKFDTGMHRLGFSWAKAEEVHQYVQKSAFQVEGVCTHLSQSIDILEKDSWSVQQIKRFHEARRFWPQAVTHVLNSDSIEKVAGVDKSEHALLGSRPGLSVYGLTGHPQLKPIARIESQLISVKEVQKGEGVSYSSTWRAPAHSRVGIVPFGYGDGYRRHFSNRGSMIFRNQRVPVVGTVCMDYTFLDLTNFSLGEVPQIGERVTVLGDGITAQELAEQLGTIPYEIMTGWSARVPRRGI